MMRKFSNTAFLAAAFLAGLVGGLFALPNIAFAVPQPCSFSTQAATRISSNAATVNGTILGGDPGGHTRGFAWGTNPNLSGGDTATTTEFGTFSAGPFTGRLTGLQYGTTYYARAYCINSAGLGSDYSGSSIISFTVNGIGGFSRPPNNLGLVGYWSFNDATSTTATDFSGNGNHGTLNTFADPPTASSGWTSGKRGGALVFDDATDYVSLPANSSLYASDGTVSFWMKSTTDALGTPFSATLGNSTSDYFSIETGPSSGLVSNEIVAVFSGPADYGLAYTTTNRNELFDGQWHHVAIVIDTATKIYIDGVEKTVTVFNGVDLGRFTSHGSLDTFRIGDARTSSTEKNFFGGSLDEVRIYNRALTATEVATLAGAGGGGGAARFGSSAELQRGSTLTNGLVGHWTFDGGDTRWTSMTAGTAFDLSGNGNMGTITNMNAATARVPGKLGQAFQFLRSSSQQVNAGTGASLSLTSSMTLAAWVKQSEVGAGTYGIIGKTNISSGWALLTFNDLPYVEITGTGGTPIMNRLSNVNMARNTWYHVVAVYDAPGQTLDMYVNGVLANGALSDTVPSSQQNSTDSVRIGTYFNSEFFSGVIDDARVYNRALTAAEVKQLYQLGGTTIVP